MPLQILQVHEWFSHLALNLPASDASDAAGEPGPITRFLRLKPASEADCEAWRSLI